MQLAIVPPLTTRGTPRKYLRFARGTTRQERQRFHRAKLKAAGLTVRGTLRKRRPYLGFARMSPRDRHRLTVALYRMANYVMGRTARGTVRKRFTKPFTVTIP